MHQGNFLSLSFDRIEASWLRNAGEDDSLELWFSPRAKRGGTPAASVTQADSCASRTCGEL